VNPTKRRTETRLPDPTGPFAVGRVALDLVDADRRDPYARRRGTRRKLAVWIWYPGAQPADRGRGGPYLPGAWRTTSWMWGLRGSGVRAHAADGPPPARPAHGFPLVVFSPSANPPLCYSALLQEIASHGYVVAGISHTYEVMPLSVFVRGLPRPTRLQSLGGALAAPGNRPYETDLAERARVVAVKADDIAFVAGRLVGLAGSGGRPLPPVDGSRWAAVGHSFGGGAAADVCGREAAPVAGAGLDAGLWRTPADVAPRVPFLQLFGEHPEYVAQPEDAVAQGFFTSADYAQRDRATSVGAWQALHERARPGHTALIDGATHTSFCDWPMLRLRRWSPARRALGGVSGPRVWAATSGALLAFLDRHVRGGETDVAAPLAADPALRVGPPEELFAATR
jgi:hypothetical protein